MMQHKYVKRLAVAAIGILTVGAVPAQCQTPKNFDGPYAGITLDRQNTISGALIGGVDTLRQKSRMAVNGIVGLRKEIAPRFVVGGEFSAGWMDGDLSLSDPANNLDISYDTSWQYAYGGQIGYVFSDKKDWLVFIYGKETEREFDLSIIQGQNAFSQTDKQGLFSYGLGIEKTFTDKFNLRATAGTTRVDYDDRVKNIDPENRLEFGIGAIIQF